MISILEKLSGYLIVPLGWTIITVTLMCIPGSDIPGIGILGFKNADKIVHFILYGSLTMFWAYFFLTHSKNSKWEKRVGLICFLVILFGIVMEYVQKNFIPNRDFDVMDIIANSLGAIVFSASIIIINRKRQDIKKPLWKQGL